MRPKARTPWLTACRAPSSVATSPTTAMACPPALRTSSAVSSTSAAERAAQTTRAPSRANIWLISRPMPLLAPVMIAVFPFSRPMWRSPRIGEPRGCRKCGERSPPAADRSRRRHSGRVSDGKGRVSDGPLPRGAQAQGRPADVDVSARRCSGDGGPEREERNAQTAEVRDEDAALVAVGVKRDVHGPCVVEAEPDVDGCLAKSADGQGAAEAAGEETLDVGHVAQRPLT